MTTTTINNHTNLNRARGKLRTAIIYDRQVPSAGKMVGHYLLNHYHPDKGYAWPSYDTMADDLNLPKMTVIRSVKRLEDRGYFIVRRVSKPGRALVNQYVPQFGIAQDEVCPSENVTEKGNTGDAKGSHLRSEKGNTGVTRVKEKETFSFTGKKNTRESRSARERAPALLRFFEAPEKLKSAVREVGQIRDWDQFVRKIVRDKAIRTEFACAGRGMSRNTFDNSIDAFIEKVAKQSSIWKSTEYACGRLLNWLDDEKLRGGDWGEEYDERYS